MLKTWRFEDLELERVDRTFGSYERVRFINSPDLNLAAGFARIVPDTKISFGLWFNEITMVLDGEFEVTSSLPPYFDKEDKQIFKKGDVFFVPKGAQYTFKGLPGKTCIVYYVTAPSSTK